MAIILYNHCSIIIVCVYIYIYIYIYIYNKGLIKEHDMEEILEVTGAAITSCLKRRLYNVLSNVTYSRNHH